jgi:hypothetical protein
MEKIQRPSCLGTQDKEDKDGQKSCRAGKCGGDCGTANWPGREGGDKVHCVEIDQRMDRIVSHVMSRLGYNPDHRTWH